MPLRKNRPLSIRGIQGPIVRILSTVYYSRGSQDDIKICIGQRHIPARSLLLSSHRTRNTVQPPLQAHKVLHDQPLPSQLSPLSRWQLLLSNLFHKHPSSFLPPGLCTRWSLCQEHSYLTHLLSSLRSLHKFHLLKAAFPGPSTPKVLGFPLLLPLFSASVTAFRVAGVLVSSIRKG